MIALLLSSFILIFLFVAYGYFSTRIIGIPSSHFEKFFIGLIAVNTVASYVSLLIAVNLYLLIFLIVLGMILGLACRKEIAGSFYTILGNRSILLYSLPFIIVTLLVSVNNPIIYDTGLYHIQAIKWIEEYAVVPGLANLHSRFGFNSNIFTVFALTSLSQIFDQEIFAVNFTIMAGLIVYFIHRLFWLFKLHGFSALWIFYFIMFVVVLRLPNLSSPSPDFLATTIPLFVFLRFVDLSWGNQNIRLGDYASIFLLSVYILTVKLAAIPIMIPFVLAALYYRSEVKRYIWLLPIAVFIVLPWLVRNIILTGWLVYPFPALDLFSFDWKVPIEGVINDKKAVTGWGRMPNENFLLAADMSFGQWFPLWWRELASFFKILIIMSIASPILALVYQIFKKSYFSLNINAVIISSFIGVIFWLFMAPDWRFGEVFIMTAALSPLLWLNLYWKPRASAAWAIGTPLILLWCLMTVGKANTIRAVVTDMNQSVALTPLKIEVPSNISFATYNINGITFYYPNFELEDRCFDHSIPCSPVPNPSLEIRGKSLRSGFKPGKVNPYNSLM